MPTVGSVMEFALPISTLFYCFFSTRDSSKRGRAQFPFLRYLVTIFAMFGLYEAIRAIIALVHSDASVAFANAQIIADLQVALGMESLEIHLQAWALQCPWLIVVCNHFYKQSHWTGASIYCIYYYKWKREHFYFFFRWFILSNLLAFVGFVVYPMAPPRLMTHMGIVDTIRSNGGYTKKMLDNPLINNYAAMPSMHFGYSFLYVASYFVSMYWSYTSTELPHPSNAPQCQSPTMSRRAVVVSLLFSYVTFMMFSIMVTGNHFFLDGIAGVVCVSLAYLLSHVTYTSDFRLFSKNSHSQYESKSVPYEGIGSSISLKLLTTL